MDCNSCKEKKKAAEPVPYIVHEGAMARQERANKRLWIVVIILIAALILSNAAWIYRESQFETVETTTTTVEQDAPLRGHHAKNRTVTQKGEPCRCAALSFCLKIFLLYRDNFCKKVLTNARRCGIL